MALRSLRLWLVIVVLSGVPAHAAWELTRFVVYEGSPVDAPDWRERERGRDDPVLDPAVVREIESFLFATAELYSRLGFADPLANGFFDSVVQRENGDDAIRVYVYPRENAPGGWYSPGQPCAEPATSRRVININRLRYESDRGDIPDANYQTLAHEIFHAVQFASEFRRERPCGRGLWITEGTADAIGYYAARHLRHLQFQREMQDNQFLKVVGGRHYSLPLDEPPDAADEAYATSSFWRHLAEIAWLSANGRTRPASAPVENYEYLAQFFSSPYPYGAGPGGEIAWLNGQMSANGLIGADLPTVYSQFVAAFADHIHTRIGPLGLVPNAGEREQRWLDRLFSDCPFAGPVGDHTRARFTHDMAPNSARCFSTRVEPGSIGMAVRVAVRGEDESLLRQLRMGMMDGSFTSAPVISRLNGDRPPHIASWTFPALRNARMIFIVSNMARQPASTKRFAPEFHLRVGNEDET